MSSRVVRGGSWNNNNPTNVRAAFRNNNGPTNRNNNVGFRCLNTVEQPARQGIQSWPGPRSRRA